MGRISPEHIGLRDAADMFGVSIDTLRRRIRDNQLDEAQLVQGPFGATWVLPRADLAEIADREQWDLEGVSRAPATDRVIDLTAPTANESLVAGLPRQVASPPPARSAGGAVAAVAPPAPAPPIPSTGQPGARGTAPMPPAPAVAVSGSQAPGAAAAVSAPARSDSAQLSSIGAEIAASVSEEIAKGLSDNVQAELRAVRDAITAAEVRAVAADARTDALRAEKGRLEAQLKRAEADIEYWRSQHDRLDKDLDRERTQRVASDKAKAISEAETREVRGQVATLSTELHEAQSRERALITEEGRLRAELDQATVSMGWWSRRRFERLQARSHGSTPPTPAGE